MEFPTENKPRWRDFVNRASAGRLKKLWFSPFPKFKSEESLASIDLQGF